MVAKPKYVSFLKFCLLVTLHISPNYVDIIIFSGGSIILDTDSSVSPHNSCANVLMSNKLMVKERPLKLFSIVEVIMAGHPVSVLSI